MEPFLQRLSTALAERYAVEREIGSGGMSTVYLAEDLKHRRKVAVKILRPELSAAIGPERFLREIEIAASLAHPHILPLFDSGQADGLLYYVMPYVEEESLRERLGREPRLGVEEAIRLAEQVASALAHAHERGVVHRDVKPGNILLVGDRAVVADFGIARAMEAAGVDGLTGTGHALGTPAYMSPEQAFGSHAVDGRADIYALGCVVYEMIAGAPPFPGRTPQALFAMHAAKAVPRLRKARPDAPAFLEAAVGRALAKDPADRFETASELAEALRGGTVHGRGRRTSRRRVAAGVAAVAAAVLLGGLAWPALDRSGLGLPFGAEAPTPAPMRLMVLPFENLTGDAEQDFLSDGIADDVRTELGRLHPEGLRVIARASSLPYRDRAIPLDRIGREAGVDYVLDGSARREGTRVRINAALTQVDDGTQVWAESFDRELASILTLQSDVARGVATSLALELLPDDETRLAARRYVDPGAYEAYLRGVSYVERSTPADFDRAMEYFELALERDPSFARAHSGIAHVWAARQQASFVAPAVARPMQRAAIDRALELDPMLPEAIFARATQQTWSDWEWAAAEPLFRRAIDLDPGFARARAYYAQYLHIMGRVEEAMVQAERALELDPLNPEIRATVGGAYLMARRYDQALEQFRAVARMEPGSLRSLVGTANALHYAERWEEAFEAERALTSVGRGDDELAEALTEGYAEGGYTGAMLRAAGLLESRSLAGAGGANRVARYYLLAGEAERALDWLERSFEERDPSLPFLASGHKAFDLVRGHPRYDALLRRLNLQ